MTPASTAPLLRVADFQTAWYLSILASGVVFVSAWAIVAVARGLRPMWRAGDRALAVLVMTVTAITTSLFASMLAMVGIGLLGHVG